MYVSRTSISSETPDIVLESIFNSYDVDHNHKLDQDEFDKLLDRLGIDENDKEIIMQLADSNNDHVIDYNEFRDLVQKIGVEKILQNKNREFELLQYTYETFKQYDVDNNGVISWPEFYVHLTKYGFTNDQISAYWIAMDVNHDSSISFEEFWRGFAPQVQNMFKADKKLDKKLNIDNEKDKNNNDKNNNNTDEQKETESDDKNSSELPVIQETKVFINDNE